MRFKHFTLTWKKFKLSEVCEINPKTPDLQEKFYYIDLESVQKGELIQKNIINKTSAPSRAQRVLSYNDICFQCVRPYQLNNYHFKILDNSQWVASTGYAQLRSKSIDANFIYQTINSPRFNYQVLLRCTGSSYPAINSNDLGEIEIGVCSADEQIKIAHLLSKIDERISTQSKIIEDLELYKNKIAHQLIYNNPLLDKTTPLKKYATLKNGYAFKSDTYSESGNYKVITIANVTGNKYISTTDCNSIETLPKDIQSHQILKLGDILISLTGNVGRVSIVNEINCLLNQRVGVLFFTNIQLKKYLFQVLSNKLFETKMVQKGQGAAQKNIGNEDVESFLIPISNNLEYMNKITKVLDVLDEKLALEKQILEKLKEQKKFLLSNMFI